MNLEASFIAKTLYAASTCLVCALARSSNAHESLDATLWMQTSAEYRAIVAQIYSVARQRLPDALEASPLLGAVENGPDAAAKPPAVILDIDEAVLDNGPSQASAIIRGQHEFDHDAWNGWVMRHKATALPGALEYVKAAETSGMAVFYVTNRTCTSPTYCPQQDATIRNLQDLGFPKIDDHRLLMKNEQPAWTSEKSTRRAEIATDFRIVQIIGDDLGDFVPGARRMNPEERLDMVARHDASFGLTWHLLPNPLYGSWRAVLGERPASFLQPDLEQLCLGRDTPIGHVQGLGDTSPCAGLVVSTRGIVTLVSTGDGGLGGYFLQDPAGDGNAATSDGVFVVDGQNLAGLAAGDIVAIKARVSERHGMTALEPEGARDLAVLAKGLTVMPDPLRLSDADGRDLERYEGMLVTTDGLRPEPVNHKGVTLPEEKTDHPAGVYGVLYQGPMAPAPSADFPYSYHIREIRPREEAR